MRALALVLLAFGTGRAQEAYFKEPEKRPWMPTWDVEFRQDRAELGPGKPTIERAFARFRLRWDLGGDEDWIQGRLQTAHRAGSDGNRNNGPRFDNEPSNDSRLDLAELRLRWLRASGGVDVQGGLSENRLMATEALWDPDLRLLGGSARAFWRSASGAIEELGLRAEAGEARLFDGGRVKVRGAQVLLRGGGETFSGGLFAGPWRFEAEPRDLSRFSRQYPAGLAGYPPEELTLRAYGLEAVWHLAYPVEVKALRVENQARGDRTEEFQAWVGPRQRRWWPRFGYIRQRLGAESVMPAVNGDAWWFRVNADGQRYVLTLPLPERWSLGLSYVEQTRRGATAPVKRTVFSLTRRF